MSGYSGRAKRVDANQKEIVEVLRSLGATVQVLSSVGNGCPDILIGYKGRNYLAELKDGSKIPSKQKLTPEEKAWIEFWQGQVSVVSSVPEAIALLGLPAFDF